MITYATFSDFTAVFSLKGVSQAEISSAWLPQGALRLHEALAGYFTTPFSDNNYTAKDLNIKYAYLEILARNRVQNNDIRVIEDIDKRIEDIRQRNSPMILNDGRPLFAATTKVDAYSTTQDYNPTFTVLDPRAQRVDPELKRDEYDKVQIYYDPYQDQWWG